jgi:hypothetical protein
VSCGQCLWNIFRIIYQNYKEKSNCLLPIAYCQSIAGGCNKGKRDGMIILEVG